jgi:hypothetical protein
MVYTIVLTPHARPVRRHADGLAAPDGTRKEDRAGQSGQETISTGRFSGESNAPQFLVSLNVLSGKFPERAITFRA